MKDFQLLRYIKTFGYLIILITVVGCILVYQFARQNQSYTATVILKYVNANASEGLTPAGTEIDVSEIYSASVVTQAIQELGLSTSVESIRSGVTVEEIIPEDELIRKEALLEEGEEYEYFPTQYQVSFTGDSDTNLDYATDVLNAIIDAYLIQYSTKYIDDVSFPQNAANVSVEKYDYIECVDLLQESCNQIVGYLSQKDENYPGFRSTQTGYALSDLQDEYEYIRDTELQKLYAMILNNQIAQDRDVLLTNYANKLTLDRINLTNTSSTLEKTRALIQQFGTKTLDGSNYSFSGTDVTSSGLILADVELDNNRITNTITTYDKLIHQYLTLHSEQAFLERSILNYQTMYDTFSQAATGTYIPQGTAAYVSQEITEIAADMSQLYDVVCDTMDEYNGVVSARNINVLTSVAAYSNLSLPIYTGLAMLIFLFMGCCAAIALGRLGDFMNYFLYIDRKTNLPNRGRCDLQVEKYSAHLLPDWFACLYIQFRFDGVNQAGVTRKSGDNALKKLGKILNSVLSSEGFVGYNNSGQFIGLFEHCNEDKVQTMVDRITAEIEYANSLEPSESITINVGHAISNVESIYDVRKLLQAAIKNSKQ